MPHLSFNMIIVVSAAAALGIAVLAGEGRVKKAAIGGLVGFLVATQLGKAAQTQLARVPYTPKLSLYTVQLGLLVLVTLLFNLGRVHHVEGRPRVTIESIALAILTALFLLTAALSLAPPSTREQLVTDYNLAALFYNYRLLWLALTAASLLLVELMGANTKKRR